MEDGAAANQHEIHTLLQAVAGILRRVDLAGHAKAFRREPHAELEVGPSSILWELVSGASMKRLPIAGPRRKVRDSNSEVMDAPRNDTAQHAAGIAAFPLQRYRSPNRATRSERNWLQCHP